MPEYPAPGVYVEEIERGPKPIEGVPTSTAAFLGETECGSTKPRLVSSYEEYRHGFGGAFGTDQFMPDAVNGFFENGGQRVFVCRLAEDQDVLQALAALEGDAYREVALVYAPGAAVPVSKALIAHCESLRFRFAIIDCGRNVVDMSALEPRATIQDSGHAAFYGPWVVISDPQTGQRKTVPPGGHALGVYARTDATRGVFKAPANEVLHGVLEPDSHVDDATAGLLSLRGVNLIRRLPGRGVRLWGAHTMASNPLWKYVSVRRLFIFLERSIYEGTQWVVFEPNDQRLWARVSDTIRLFLRGQWRLGALSGRTEAQAFFVTCDESTMTQDDILNGRLVCEIGVAPLKPAEFVIFRIFQHTAEAQR
jgi:phage tail sheath protein FI